MSEFQLFLMSISSFAAGVAFGGILMDRWWSKHLDNQMNDYLNNHMPRIMTRLGISEQCQNSGCFFHEVESSGDNQQIQ